MELSDDKHRLRLRIDAELTATELETLIGELADLRAQMEPSVPIARPRPASAAASQTVFMQDDPSVTAAALEGGGIRLWLRSSGLGWLGFSFTAAQVAPVVSYITAHIGAVAAPSLIKKGCEDGDPTKRH